MVTKGRRFVVPFFMLGLQVALIIFIAMTMSMMAPNSDITPDAIMVLGCGVENKEPGPILRERLESAIAYAEEYPDVNIYVTGGYDRGEEISEGAVMKTYLLDHGVTNPIFVEEASTSTYENFLYTLPMMDKKDHLVVISSDYHSLRIRLLMARFNLVPEIVKSQTPVLSWPHHFMREILANVKTFFVDW